MRTLRQRASRPDEVSGAAAGLPSRPRPVGSPRFPTVRSTIVAAMTSDHDPQPGEAVVLPVRRGDLQPDLSLVISPVAQWH
jgi:hypothetical protein